MHHSWNDEFEVRGNKRTTADVPKMAFDWCYNYWTIEHQKHIISTRYNNLLKNNINDFMTFNQRWWEPFQDRRIRPVRKSWFGILSIGFARFKAWRCFGGDMVFLYFTARYHLRIFRFEIKTNALKKSLTQPVNGFLIWIASRMNKSDR